MREKAAEAWQEIEREWVNARDGFHFATLLRGDLPRAFFPQIKLAVNQLLARGSASSEMSTNEDANPTQAGHRRDQGLPVPQG